MVVVKLIIVLLYSTQYISGFETSQDSDQISDISVTLHYLQQGFAEMQHEMKKMQIENINSRHELHELKDEMQHMNTSIREGDEKKLDLIKQLRDELKQSQQLQEVVSFTAYNTEEREFAEGETILFDGVLTNYGTYYNPISSTFECPQRGYYLFYCSIYVRSTTYSVSAEVIMDGQTLVGVYNSGEYTQGGNAVVMLCEQYGQVSVRAVYDSMMSDSGTRNYSTFSGTLLFLAPTS